MAVVFSGSGDAAVIVVVDVDIEAVIRLQRVSLLVKFL